MMKSLRYNPITLLAVAVSLTMVMTPARPVSAQEEDQVDLRPHFVAGQVSRYEIWSLRRQVNTVQVGAEQRSFQTSYEVSGELTWRVDRVNSDGSAQCTMTIDWLTMAVTGPDGKVLRNDSRQGRGDLDAAQDMLRALAGTPLNVDMAADGSAVKVRGVEAMRRKAPEGVSLPEELDFLETASDLATIPYAPPAVRLGGGWDAQFTWSHELGWLDYQTRYTLNSTEQVADIPLANVQASHRLTLRADPQKLGVPADGPRVEARLLSGSAQSQIMFDLQRHEAVGRNNTQDTRIQVDISLPGAPQTVKRTIDESIQSQALRITEE